MTNTILTQPPKIPADAIQNSDGKIFTTSLQVAEIFTKPHKDVLKKIQNLDCSPEFTERNFSLCFKINELANNKKIPYYEMTKNGFTFLVMGYNGKKAASYKEAYIGEFDRMADELNKRERLQLENSYQRRLAESREYLPQPMEIPDEEREKYRIINGMMRTLDLKSDPVLVPKQDFVNALYPQMGQIASWENIAECARIAEERIRLVMQTAHVNPDPYLRITR